MDLPDVLAVIVEVTGALERLQVPYFVGGSIASSIHGIPRSTQDGDLVADLRPEHVQPLVEALSARFYIDSERMADAIRREASFNVIHLGTMTKVDIFILRSTLPSPLEMERRHRFPVSADTILYISSPEDIILEKLRWFRKGGGVSDRQWDDVLGVLKVQRGILDLDYLNRWASELDLGDLLEKALEDSGNR